MKKPNYARLIAPARAAWSEQFDYCWLGGWQHGTAWPVDWWVAALDTHEIITRAQAPGRWWPEDGSNGTRLCRYCHSLIHAWPSGPGNRVLFCLALKLIHDPDRLRLKVQRLNGRQGVIFGMKEVAALAVLIKEAGFRPPVQWEQVEAVLNAHETLFSEA